MKRRRSRAMAKPTPSCRPTTSSPTIETWDKGNLDLSEAKKPEMLEFEYARSALKNGLKLEQQLGVNPYKFGMIGSTDAHTGLTAVEEENFFGKASNAEPSAERWSHPFIKNQDRVIITWETTASGYAAVWATENTREALFDAMERRETYATTGPRLIVRFFGGWEFEAKDAQNRLPAQIGYTKGVPMGGDLRDAPAGKSPTFLVAALKDPIGANLDRIQIVKGWLDKQGETPGEGLRRRLVGRPQSRRRRQAAAGGKHRRRAERHLDQHHRRPRADHGLERPGLRPGAAGLLLCPRHRNPDAALDRV